MSTESTKTTAVVRRSASESTELHGYRVEARTFAPGIIKEVAGIQYSHDWKEVSFQSSPYDIPGDIWSDRLILANCFSHAQALALAWWFKANASSLGVFFLSVRIVRYKVRLSWSAEPDGFVSDLPEEDRTDKSFTQVEIVEP